MVRLTTQLRRWGVDPATFTGQYTEQLNRRGVTRPDWDSVLGAFSEPTWSKVRGSIDIVVARALTCGALAGPKADCGRDAFALARRIDPAVDGSILLAVLQGATADYDASSWGYEQAGDGTSATQTVGADFRR